MAIRPINRRELRVNFRFLGFKFSSCGQNKKVNFVCRYYYVSGERSSARVFSRPRRAGTVGGERVVPLRASRAEGGRGGGARGGGGAGFRRTPEMVNNGRAQKVSEMLRRRGGAPAQSRSRPTHVRRVSGAWEGRGGEGS